MFCVVYVCVGRHLDVCVYNVTICVCVGETFVTRKVTRSVAQIHLGNMESVSADLELWVLAIA